jgi:ATPase subunit of ABC transporter with duplicated ATPase domains
MPATAVTKSQLRDLLDTLAGCAIVMSRDRWFLDRLAKHVLTFEGDNASTGSIGTFRNVKRTGENASAPTPRSRIGFAIGS